MKEAINNWRSRFRKKFTYKEYGDDYEGCIGCYWKTETDPEKVESFIAEELKRLHEHRKIKQ